MRSRRRMRWDLLLGAGVVVCSALCGPHAVMAQCENNGAGTFTNGDEFFTIEGGQISMAGASMFVDFFAAPASTNDWNDVDGDGKAGFFSQFPYTDNLAETFAPSQDLESWWVFQYRSIGSVNGMNEFVDNQTCGAIPLGVPSERGLFNQFQWAKDGEKQWTGGHNRTGTPLQPCEIEGAFLDVPSSWAIQYEGVPHWDASPLESGYGQGNDIPSSTGFISTLLTLTRACGECSVSYECSLNGMPCEEDDDCLPDGGTCTAPVACVEDDNCPLWYNKYCSIAGTSCDDDEDCPGEETCDPSEVCVPTGVEVSLNKDFVSPDEDTIYDFTAAWIPVSIISNRGTGIENAKYSELQYLFTTGRMPNGENLTACSRDIGSGTRNAAMNSLGVDPSWGRGENLGSKTKDKSTDNLGAEHQPSNKGGSSRMEGAIQNNRLGVGYTGLGGTSRSGLDAANGKYEILGLCKDLDLDGDGEPDCDCSQYVRPTVNTVLGNCDPCTGYQIAGSGSFVVRGDIAANETGYTGSNPPLDNQAVADYLNNIFSSIESFTTGQVFPAQCDASLVCGIAGEIVKHCDTAPFDVCEGDGDCAGNCVMTDCFDDSDCFGGETCDIGKPCNGDSDCPTLVCSESRLPCQDAGDCPGEETCDAPDFCKEKLNMPGSFLATTFFLREGLDCLHEIGSPLEYTDTATNESLQDFIRDENGLGWGADPDGADYEYGNVTPAGLVSKRNSLLKDVYSDGSGGGSYTYWTGMQYVTNLLSGLQLSERNALTGDFNDDGVRGIDDAAEMVAAYYAPRTWQKSAAANGSGDKGDMSADNTIPEVIGDFNGDGNFNKEDLRYWMDGLAMVDDGRGGLVLDRKEGAIAIDDAIAAQSEPYPWSDQSAQLLVPPGSAGNDPTFSTPTPIDDMFPAAIVANTGKTYQPGDFRGDVAGSNGLGGVGPIAGAPPLGWDGRIDDKDLTYCARAAYAGGWDVIDSAILTDLSCDTDGNMEVDYDDVRALLGILNTDVGDVDLDGDVDSDDEQIVLDGHTGQCNDDGSCGWLDGDVTGDGTVDSQDLFPWQVQPPLPEDSLGITDCTADEECANEAKCVLGTCYAPKHRYISIAHNPFQTERTARRISLQGGGAGPWWVGAPYEASGLTVADVVDEPVYADYDFVGDWPDLVNVTGCEIATNQTYLVQAIPMGADISEEANYSTAIALHTPTIWGDVVSTCLYYNCEPPQGEVNIDDILAAIAAFQSSNNDPLTWFDIAPALGDGVPNQMVDIDDILANIHGFQSKSYPGLGPLDCP